MTSLSALSAARYAQSHSVPEIAEDCGSQKTCQTFSSIFEDWLSSNSPENPDDLLVRTRLACGRLREYAANGLQPGLCDDSVWKARELSNKLFGQTCDVLMASTVDHKPLPEQVPTVLKTLDDLGLWNNGDNNSMLQRVISVAHPEDEDRIVAYIEWLQRQGVDINTLNRHGQSALHTACFHSLPKVVHALIEKMSPSSLQQCDNQGLSPLHHAACRNSVDIILDLLRVLPKEARVVKSLCGRTPLHRACLTTSPLNVISALLSEMPKEAIGWTDSGGNTLLHAVCERALDVFEDHYKDVPVLPIVDTLLKTSAIDVDRRNERGNTALHYCCSGFYPVAMHLIPLMSPEAIDAANHVEDTALDNVCNRPSPDCAYRIPLINLLVEKISTATLKKVLTRQQNLLARESALGIHTSTRQEVIAAIERKLGATSCVSRQPDPESVAGPSSYSSAGNPA